MRRSVELLCLSVGVHVAQELKMAEGPNPSAATTSATANKPRLAKLRMLKSSKGQKVEIIQELAPKWKDFGIFLDFDSNGQKLDLIEAEHTQKVNAPVACCQAMFQHWLSGNGVPATWDTLMELLQDAKQSHLAQQIKSILEDATAAPAPSGDHTVPTTHGSSQVRYQEEQPVARSLPTAGTPQYCCNMLLIGEIGSGKTSFLNLLCNCSLLQELGFAKGAGHFHDYNDIKLENPLAGKMESKTSGAKLYNLELCGIKMGVVDTPGFGDSRGMEEDKQNVDKIIDTLKEEDYLNCVCLIINGRQSRMSAALRYVLTEVTSILPKEIVSNVIVLFTTTADPLDLNFDPSQLKTFFGREIDDSRTFYIENPYCRHEKAKTQTGELLPEKITHSLQKSFDETSLVLAEMSTTVKDFQRVHTFCFFSLYQKKQEVEATVNSLLVYQQEIEKKISEAESDVISARNRKILNSPFRSTQRIRRWKVVSTERHNTLCGAARCYCNCHAPCYCISKSFDKEAFKQCRAFRGSVTCKVCGHSYAMHYHDEVKFDLEEYTQDFIDPVMKNKFEEAKAIEERATIVKQQLERQRETTQPEWQRLSDRLRLTLEKFYKLGIVQNYAKLLESQLAMVQHRLESSVGPEIQDLRRTEHEIEKKLQLVAAI